MEAREHNEKLRATLEAARGRHEGKGVARAKGSAAVHAARGVLGGHSGFFHPRPLCVGHTTRQYFSLTTDQDQPVTCKRCLASMVNSGFIA